MSVRFASIAGNTASSKCFAMPSIASLVLVLTSFIEFFTYSKSWKVWVFFNLSTSFAISSTFLTRPLVSLLPFSPKTASFKSEISWPFASSDDSKSLTLPVKSFTLPANSASLSPNVDNTFFSSSNLSPCSSVNSDILFNSSTILSTLLASTLLSNLSDNCFNWYAKVGASSEPSLNTNEANSLSLLLISLIFLSCSALVASAFACNSDLIASFRALVAVAKGSVSAAIETPETAAPTIRAITDCFNILFFIRSPYYGFRVIKVSYVQHNILDYQILHLDCTSTDYMITLKLDQLNKMIFEKCIYIRLPHIVQFVTTLLKIQ